MRFKVVRSRTERVEMYVEAETGAQAQLLADGATFYVNGVHGTSHAKRLEAAGITVATHELGEWMSAGFERMHE